MEISKPVMVPASRSGLLRAELRASRAEIISGLERLTRLEDVLEKLYDDSDEPLALSRYEYDWSRQASGEDWPFYGIIMLAMRRADSGNLERLKAVFPQVWQDLEARHRAVGGVLPREEG